jgi:Flp pilus assembly protein TadG
MWRVINKLRRLWPRGRAGVTSLEFALVVVAFFLMLFGVVDVARYFLTWHGLNSVASEAARASQVNNWSFACGHPSSGTAATVAGAAPFLATSQLTLCVVKGTSTGLTTISVTASYPFSFMIALFAGANGTLQAQTALTY